MTKAITGVKTAAQKTVALKNAKGPKAGSARANQSAKYEPEAKPAPKATKLAKSDIIATVQSASGGAGYICVTAPGNKTLPIPQKQMTGKLAKLAVVGGSYKAASDEWESVKANPPMASAARGVDSHNSPHVAKALADQRAKAKPAAKADAKPAAKVTAKAKPAAKADAKADRAYKVVVKLADIKLRPDTWTERMVQIIMAHTSTDAASAALAKDKTYGDRKLDFKWAADARGYIKF